MREYRHKNPAGWSNAESYSAFYATAAKRVLPGRGPFSLIVDGEKEPVVDKKSRIRVLRALGHNVKTRRYGTEHRIRNKDKVVFVGKPVNIASSVRKDILRWGRWMVSNRSRIHYSQNRPYTRYRAGTSGSITLDCSAAYANLCMWSRAQDPFGNGYNGSGNSYELHATASIPKAQALPGDGVSWNGHVAMLLEPGSRSDPLLFSHGSEAGPYAYRLSSAVRIHGSGYKMHRLRF